MTKDFVTESERLVIIEQMIAHQDQQIHDLSDMVNRQWHEIDRLKRNLSQTEQRLESLESTPKDDELSHEIPPHY